LSPCVLGCRHAAAAPRPAGHGAWLELMTRFGLPVMGRFGILRDRQTREAPPMAGGVGEGFRGDFRDLQDILLSTESVEEFLHQMAVLAASLVGEGMSCGMTMRPSGAPVTVACSDEVAGLVDEVQYTLDDGPCLHAMRTGQVTRIEDTAEKERWPEFEAQAAARGIRSCLALPLNTDGALNMYSRAAFAFGPAETRRAEEFARNAAGALTLAVRLASHAELIDQLRSSMASRTVIDQALGIIMARERCGQARAFAILRTASPNSNVKLRDIASAIVTSISGEPPVPPPPFEEG